MQYDKVVNDIVCNRDVYAEQFATASDPLKINYMVSIDMEVIAENEDTKVLAKQLKAYSEQLLKWSNHFQRMGKK